MQRSLTLALTGDVMLGRQVAQAIQRRGYRAPWGDVLPLLAAADLRLVNLECALTAETKRWYGDFDKPFHFRADPPAVETLSIARVDFATVANNHIGDFGMAGLLETLRVLDGAGIAHAGAGQDRERARTPARMLAGDWRVTVVAAADHPVEWEAGPDQPGINLIAVGRGPGAFDEAERQIRAARAGSDLVIFTIHWGPNMRERPSPEFQEFARRVIDAGADVFWGHSAHVVQGVEFRRGRAILYDTGDFVDDYAVDDRLRNDLSGLFLLEISPADGQHLEVVPVSIDDMRVSPAEGAERAWFVRRFGELCAELGTTVVEEPGRRAVEVRPGGPGPKGRR